MVEIEVEAEAEVEVVEGVETWDRVPERASTYVNC
jgi:hypothetical protein